MEFARKHKKPRLHLHPGVADAAIKLRTFVKENSVQFLNVAGPRASHEPEVDEFMMRTVGEAFCDMTELSKDEAVVTEEPTRSKKR